jgi:hypothetical protein
MGDHGERPSQAIRRVGPGEKARVAGDAVPDDMDTEGHRVGPGESLTVGPGEQVIRADGTPADFLDDRDTEGHFEFRRLPGDGGE